MLVHHSVDPSAEPCLQFQPPLRHLEKVLCGGNISLGVWRLSVHASSTTVSPSPETGYHA